MYKERGKCNIEARIEFTVPKFSEFRNPIRTFHKVFEKMSEICRKNKGKNYFSYILLKKLDHNLGQYAKNQREISSYKVKRLLWPLGRGKCGKGGEMV